MMKTQTTWPLRDIGDEAWWPLESAARCDMRRGDVIYEGPFDKPTMFGRFVGWHRGRSSLWIIWRPNGPGLSTGLETEFSAACNAFDLLYGPWSDPAAILM